jgi:3-hydroxyacyl-CoA dehydrogenase
MLAAGNDSFYRNGAVYDPAKKTYVAIPRDPREIVLSECPVIKSNRSASLRDLGDRVLCLEFHSKMNTLDADIRTMIVDAVDEVERGDWSGLVIGNEGADFCIGANLKILDASVHDAVKAMQDALMRIRFCSKPVVSAPFSRVLGGGVEIVMSSARAVAASESYVGLVEVGGGLIPGACGCKEMVRRIVSSGMKRTPNADPLQYVQNVMQTVGAAKVSTSAEEARSFGFLSEGDRVVMNRDHLLYEAKQEVIAMAEAGYTSPAKGDTCYASGRDVRAAVKAAIHVLKQGAFMSEYDAFVSGKLAHILCGAVTAPTWVSEQHILDLEREAFVELCSQPKTQERIKYMLETGKPLRN